MQKNCTGFTLIELLVVVLIIGILASVALPQYQKAVAKSRAMEILSIGRSIGMAERAYFMANGHYATSLDELDISFASGTTNNYNIGLYDDANARMNIVSKNGYGRWDFHLNRNTAACIAHETKPIENSVCASITGNNSPSKGNEVYNYYSMQFL